MISLDKIIARSALLILLQKKDKLKIENLVQIIPDWKNTSKYLRKIGLKIEENNGYLELKTSVSFDLYQSIPSEILNDVSKLIWKLIPSPVILDSSTISHIIFEPNSIDNSQNVFSCINCADAPCMTYKFTQFGSVDKFPNRVCPDDLINLNKDGIVTIDDSTCTGCMICLSRCPLNSIYLENKLIKIKKYSASEIKINVTEKNVRIDEQRRITNVILGQITSKSKDFVLQNTICDILDNFDNKVSQQNWDRDKYYVFIRNLFRELGLKAMYTGASGKLRRADVTIEVPFLVGIEIKSPAESDVNVSAIRQAIDARLEVHNTYDHALEDTFCAAIAQGIARGAHTRAVANQEMNVIIPIITGRVLLYILLKHQTNLPQDTEKDLKLLFTNFVGEITSDALKNYFSSYFDRRIKECKTNSISLPLPLQIDSIKKEQTIQDLKELKNQTLNEINLCFPPSTRTPRGKTVNYNSD